MKCNECENNILQKEDRWECSFCGLIIEENLLEKNPDRFENNKLVRHKDKILGSVVGFGHRGNRLRRIARNASPQERSTIDGYYYCNMVANEFNMTESAKDTVKQYYSTLKNKHIFTSRMPLELRAAAIGYIVLREFGYAYTLREVRERLEIPKRKISRLSRRFARTLGKGHIFQHENPYPLIEKFALRLGKSRDFMNDVHKLYEHVNKVEFYGPTSPHLSAMFYVVEMNQPHPILRQTQIAEMFGVIPLTIRKNVKHMKVILMTDDIMESVENA
jgi:transcription initiation factor TFIIIB Brf1 subunit/transcription initiation factor TFIIB